MKIRSFLRNESLQLELEKKGAVVSPFLFPENSKWLRGLFQENTTNSKDASAVIALHEKLNEKLQSKVEYRCINCSPFQVYFNTLADYTRQHQAFFLQPSITDESRFSSLHLIAPLLQEADSPMEFCYLAGAHLLAVPPRGKNIPGYYEHEADFVVQNFSKMKVKPGEAVIFFGNIPYTITPHTENEPQALLEISILPYEARQIIYEGLTESGEDFLQPYETEFTPFIEYQSGNAGSLIRMKPLRKIPFTPSCLSDKEKQKLFVKVSLQKLFLKIAGLSKFL